MVYYNVVIYDDRGIDVAGIKSFLSKIPEIKVIGNYDTSKEVMSKCLECPIDLVIVDGEIRGDKNAGARLVKQIKEKLVRTKVLGLTNFPECLQAMRSAGADYVVLKQFLENEKDAEKYIREALFNPKDIHPRNPPPKLAEEEDRALKMIACGWTEKEMGSYLGLTMRKVKEIKNRLFNKFGARNSPNLVAHAYQTGYLDPDDDLEFS
jgi:two-component system response regulator NreC